MSTTDPTQPIGMINPQTLSNPPFPSQTTLMDDSTALMDDPTALFGANTTQIAVLLTTSSTNAPKVGIQYRR